MGQYDLIIFDCDGTLVDSEYLNNKVSSDVLIEYGLSNYTPEKCVEEFAGSAWSSIKEKLDKRHNINLPQTVITDYIDRVNREMETALQPIDGALDFVKSCHGPYKIAVASNGERKNVLKSLRLMGFMNYLGLIYLVSH